MPRDRVTGCPVTAGASSAWPRRREPGRASPPWGSALSGSPGASTLSTSCRRAADSTSARSTGWPAAAARNASQAAISATARTWRTCQGGGWTDRRRAAAAARPGTDIGSMIRDRHPRLERCRQRSAIRGSPDDASLSPRPSPADWAGRGGCPSPAGADAERVPVEGHVQRSVQVRAVRRDAVGDQPGEGLRRGVTERVPRPDRDEGHGRVDRAQQGVRRRGPASVVGHLEDVDVGEPARHQDGIDFLLDVAGEQEALGADRAEQHDRHVVDPGSRVGRSARHAARIRPQHPERDPVEREAVSR